MRTNTTMKLTALAAAMGLVVSSGVMAAATQTAEVTYAVPVINEITVADLAPTFTFEVPAAGAAFNPTLEEVSSWDVTTNQSGQKLVAELDESMPAGLTLEIDAAAPAAGEYGGTPLSLGAVTMTSGAQELVSGITKLADDDLVLTYSLSATLEANNALNQARQVVFTITGS